MAGIRIVGYGKASGGRFVTNDELSQKVDTSDAWIRSKTGIEGRYFAEERMNVAMAAEAAEDALAGAGVGRKRIKYLIVCTFTPDDATPSVACGVASALGLSEEVMAMDLNGACSGFVYGVHVAQALLSIAGKDALALVIGSEKISPLLNWEDRGSCVLFGDGAGAIVACREEGNDFGADFGTVPDAKVLRCDRFQPSIYMQGQEVYRFAVNTVPASIERLLEKQGLAASDVDWFICHQANLRIIKSIASKLGVPMERFYINIDRYGNTSAASIGICLAEMMEKGLLQRGQRVICAGFGAGLTYGSMLVTI